MASRTSPMKRFLRWQLPKGSMTRGIVAGDIGKSPLSARQMVVTVSAVQQLAGFMDADANTTERELLRRAGQRDEGAVRTVYRTHVGRVHRHVARLLGSKDADIEDVVQQVFMAALECASRFDGRSTLSTWLLGIATRRAFDHQRQRWRQGRWRRVTEVVGMGRQDGQPGQLHAAQLAEAALAKIEPHLRTVFVLHEVEGYTLAEVGQMTGAGISTVHARLQAARRKLDGLGSARHENVGGEDDDAA